MNDRIQSLRYKVGKVLHGHEAFVVSLVVLILLTGLFLRIHSLNNLPEDEEHYQSQISNIKTVKFNQDAIKQIQQLRDSNVAAPGTALPDNRENPFVE